MKNYMRVQKETVSLNELTKEERKLVFQIVNKYSEDNLKKQGTTREELLKDWICIVIDWFRHQ